MQPTLPFLSLAVAAHLFALSASVWAQPSTAEPQETRGSILQAAQEMEALQASARNREQREGYRERARVLRERLEVGDLRVGDQIIVEGINLPNPALSDTFTVGQGQILRLPGIPSDIPLRGVLRFELDQHLIKFLERTILDPQLRTSTMLGLFVTGQVVAPGTRSVRRDAQLRDLVSAGSITPLADINRITVSRRGVVLFAADSSRRALEQGRTLADLNLVAGDEIEIGMKRQTNVNNLLQMATGILSLAISIYAITR
jgi:hypothetical protein